MVSPVAATPDGLRRPGLAVHCCSGFEDAQEGGRSPTGAVLLLYARRNPSGTPGP